jgi:hypothetical protein
MVKVYGDYPKINLSYSGKSQVKITSERDKKRNSIQKVG